MDNCYRLYTKGEQQNCFEMFNSRVNITEDLSRRKYYVSKVKFQKSEVNDFLL